VIAQLDSIESPSHRGRIVFTDGPIPLDLNPASIAAAVEEMIPSAAGPVSELRKSFDWATVSIEPRGHETDGFIVEAGRPHDRSPLQTAQNALQRNVRHLSAARERGIPLVVTLSDSGFIRDFHASVENVLLGEPKHYLARDEQGGAHMMIARTGRAALFSTRAAHPGLSAVLVVDKRLLDGGVFLGLELWHHPFAANPLPRQMLGPIMEHTATSVGTDVWDITPAEQLETVLSVEEGFGGARWLSACSILAPAPRTASQGATTPNRVVCTRAWSASYVGIVSLLRASALPPPLRAIADATTTHPLMRKSWLCPPHIHFNVPGELWAEFALEDEQ
jgi:hypothetical protein